MELGFLPGGVFRGAAFGDLEAEGLADVKLPADKRRDELRPLRVPVQARTFPHIPALPLANQSETLQTEHRGH